MRLHTLTLPVALALCTACGEATIDVPEAFAVISVSPHHGAINVSANTTVEIGFNDDLVRDTVDDKSLRLLADGVEVTTEQLVDASARSVTLVPAQVLQWATGYDVIIGPAISGKEKGELETTVRTRFRTLAGP